MSITAVPPITATETYTWPGTGTESGFSAVWNITWTNLGPLTTTFTPPASCSTPVGQLIALSDGQLTGGWCSTAPPWLDCQPYGAAYSPLWAVNESAFWTTYNSPGLYCPSGYSTADSFTIAPSDVLNTTLDGNTLRTTGTHVFCCPSGYSSTTRACVTSVTTATSTSLCDYINYSEMKVTGSDGSATASYVVTPSPFSWTPANQSNTTLRLEADPVYMIHQQSDVPKQGLSTRTQIAIGAVMPLVVLVVAILL